LLLRRGNRAAWATHAQPGGSISPTDGSNMASAA
jgi:hypothetical protein